MQYCILAAELKPRGESWSSIMLETSRNYPKLLFKTAQHRSRSFDQHTIRDLEVIPQSDVDAVVRLVLHFHSRELERISLALQNFPRNIELSYCGSNPSTVNFWRNKRKLPAIPN